jgi:hypothetical protein
MRLGRQRRPSHGGKHWGLVSGAVLCKIRPQAELRRCAGRCDGTMVSSVTLSSTYPPRMGSARRATLVALSAVLAFGCNDPRALSDGDGRLRRFADALATSQASHSIRRRFCLKLAEHPERSEDCATLETLISATAEKMASHPEDGPRCPSGKGTANEQDHCNCEWAWVQFGAAKAAPNSWKEIVRANNFVAFTPTPPTSFIAEMEQAGSEQATKFWTLGCKAPSK